MGERAKGWCRWSCHCAVSAREGCQVVINEGKGRICSRIGLHSNEVFQGSTHYTVGKIKTRLRVEGRSR